ncbi:MAG: CHAD domain-containing protein [Bacteroidetes bacterium]|jgi:CHAD domain-containing protein|nr:CHAD domain-containing protein [Bacteroidota bacterium]
MKKKKEKIYFNDQWDEMTVHLKNFIETGEQEELHLFRVQVKKLRAMLELLDTNSIKHPLQKDFKPVRKIFKRCGEIRNAFINLQYGQQFQFKNEDFFMNHLHEIEKGTNEVKELGKQYLKTIKLAHDDIGGDLQHVGNKDIVEFYKTKLYNISSSLENLQFNDELHATRRQIKTLMYNRKIAQDALDGKLQISNDYLDKLQTLIGDWHDNVLALELFSSAGFQSKSVITRIRSQNTRLKRSITALAHDFERKAILTQQLSMH